MTPNKIRAPNKVKLVAVLDVLKYKNLASASSTCESNSSAKAVAQRPRKITNKADFIFVFSLVWVTYKQRTIILFAWWWNLSSESPFRWWILHDECIQPIMKTLHIPHKQQIQPMNWKTSFNSKLPYEWFQAQNHEWNINYVKSFPMHNVYVLYMY